MCDVWSCGLIEHTQVEDILRILMGFRRYVFTASLFSSVVQPSGKYAKKEEEGQAINK